ncbi:MAG: M28 family metallopeptidase [Promethearchaeota archaeon]
MVVTDKKYRNYIIDFVTKICDECGTRIPTSEGEHKASDMIRAECETFADEVIFDEFRTAYNAYPQGLVRVASGFFLLGYLLLSTVVYYLVIATFFMAMVVIVLELMVMFEFIDPLYKKGTSHNVFGKIKPTGEPKFLLIFGGHTDSAYEIPAGVKYGVKMQYILYGAIGIAIISVIFAILKIFIHPAGIRWFIFNWTILDTIFYIPFLLVGLPFSIWAMYNFTTRKNKTLGANDNMAAVAASLALGHHLKEHRPKNVEVWVGSFGSEEAGQRGSKAFVQKYGIEQKLLDNSYTVVLESINGLGLAVLSAEKMYLMWPSLKPVYHSRELVDKLMKAFDTYKGEKGHRGTPLYMEHEATFAGTDATRFSQKGFKAVAILSGTFLGEGNLFPSNWHHRSDTPDKLDKTHCWHTVNISATFVDQIDTEMQ